MPDPDSAELTANGLRLLDELLNTDDKVIQAKIGSSDNKHELQKKRRTSDHNLFEERRKMLICVMKVVGYSLILLVVMFVSLTVVVLYNMVNEPEWLAKHTLAVELCKYGWSAVGGSIATKFGAFMTDAAEPLKETSSPD